MHGSVPLEPNAGEMTSGIFSKFQKFLQSEKNHLYRGNMKASFPKTGFGKKKDLEKIVFKTFKT